MTEQRARMSKLLPVLSIAGGCVRIGQLHILGDSAQFSPIQDASHQRIVAHREACEP
jgi:hypothetical protein